MQQCLPLYIIIDNFNKCIYTYYTISATNNIAPENQQQLGRRNFPISVFGLFSEAFAVRFQGMYSTCSQPPRVTCRFSSRKMHEGSPQHLSNIAWVTWLRINMCSGLGGSTPIAYLGIKSSTQFHSGLYTHDKIFLS